MCLLSRPVAFRPLSQKNGLVWMGFFLILNIQLLHNVQFHTHSYAHIFHTVTNFKALVNIFAHSILYVLNTFSFLNIYSVYIFFKFKFLFVFTCFFSIYVVTVMQQSTKTNSCYVKTVTFCWSLYLGGEGRGNLL